jgi:predicted N-acetyltransferase YhbS
VNFVAEFFEQILVQQLLVKRFEHARFHFVATNDQEVVAPTLTACAEAGEPGAASHDESRAVDGAFPIDAPRESRSAT